MAAGAWTVYDPAKKKIGNATINLSGTVFRMTLHTSASNANSSAISLYGSLDNQVTEANGYSSSGKALTAEVWTTGASAGSIKFDSDDVFWSANGGTISNIKFAVVWVSAATTTGRHVVCRSQLSTAQFNLAAGNRMTITMHASGIFTLS